MTAKRHRKRRKHRARPSGAQAKAVALQATPARSGTAPPSRDADAGLTSGRTGAQVVQVAASRKTPKAGSGWEGAAAATLPLARPGANGSVRVGPLPRPGTLLLPGRAFFAMGRPASGLLCYALQASVLGWLPAALWMVFAQRRVKRKQLILAARLRPI